MVSDKLKEIIFKKLYMDLRDVEIIPYRNSIYFIHRENKYWYFEFEKCGRLWWRYDFFNSFFEFFSMERSLYIGVMSKWVEEILNSKVSITTSFSINKNKEVEEILNSKVSTTNSMSFFPTIWVEEVLNCKVLTTDRKKEITYDGVEEVLNSVKP